MSKPCRRCKEPHEEYPYTSGRILYACPIESSCKKLENYQRNLEKRRKYEQGDVITSIEQLIKTRFVWYNYKPMSVGVLLNMQARLVIRWVYTGMLYEAVLK